MIFVCFQNQNLLLERSLHTLFAQVAPTLKQLHLCFPYNSQHSSSAFQHFIFPEPMMKLNYLALGRFYGSVAILNNLPAIKAIELWNVRFHDFNEGCENKVENCQEFVVVPTQYLSITTVIS